MKILTIEPTVGYMLKVMKSGLAITKFKDEFDAIRHGNYFDFLNLVNGPIPFMAVFKNGKITTDTTPKKNDCDFEGLLKAGPSLIIFYNSCFEAYRQILDSDISDEIYGKAALFEISLRMHSNNNKLLNEREKLIDVINKLCKFKNIPQTDIEKLHKGRIFLNMIKHNKNQFPNWKNGILAFEDSYKTLIKYQLTVV